ncbi:MAG: hypothetical protein AAF265_00885, partial [Pseudomonadota bacterium]
MLRQIFIISLLFAVCVQANAADRPFSGAQLVDQLPTETLVYVRIPHPNGLLGTAKGNALDPVLSNPDRARMVDRIISSAFDRLGQLEPELIAPSTNLLNSVRSPIEVAVVSTPGPVGVVSFVIPGEDSTDFEQWFTDLVALAPEPGVALTAQDGGLFAVDGTPAPAFAHFDGTTGSVKFLVGQALDLAAAERTVQMLDGGGEIQKEIATIDESGQGFVTWANVEQSLPMAQLFVPMEQYALLQQLGIESMRSIQFGLGVANGRSTLGARASFLPGTERKLPVFEHELGARGAGTLETVIQMAFPSEKDWLFVEELIEQNLEGDSWAEFQAGKSTLIDVYGLDLQLMTRALGPDITFFVDSVGDYIAVKIRDQKAYNAWLERLESASHVRIESRRVGRQDVKTAVIKEYIPSPNELPSENFENTQRWIALLEDLDDRLYWTEEKGYLYVSGLPQPLMARSRERKRVEVGEWLEAQQGADLSSVLFGASWNAQHLPRRLYYGYLSVLQILADVGDVPFDMFDMPTANALDLPAESSMGIAIHMGQEFVGVDITSESSPLDLVFGAGTGGTAAVALTGVLAAIAIPAYEDYTIRTEVSVRLTEAVVARDAMNR